MRFDRLQFANVLVLAFVFLSPAVTLGQKSNDAAPGYNSVKYKGAAWKEYQPAGARYSVLLPGLPREQVETIETAVGKTQLHRSMLAITYKEEFVICATNYNDYPAIFTNPAFFKKVIDSARDELLSAKTTRKLVSETEINLNSYVGREVIVEDGSLLLILRQFLVKNRMFQVLMVSPTGPKPADVVKFQTDVHHKIFSSFKILSE